jgi:hypothetical protein
MNITNDPRSPAGSAHLSKKKNSFGSARPSSTWCASTCPISCEPSQQGNREAARVAGSLLVIAAHPEDRALQAVFQSQLIDSRVPLRRRVLRSSGLLTSHDETTPLMRRPLRDIARWDPRQRAPFFATLDFENETEVAGAQANDNWRSPARRTGPGIG